MRRPPATLLVALIGLSACAPMKLAPMIRRTPVDKVCESHRVTNALAHAGSAWALLASGNADEAEEMRLLSVHAQATRDIIDALDFSPSAEWRGTRFVDTPAGRIAVRFSDGKGRGEIARNTFDVLHPIRESKPNRIVPTAQRAGIGVPLIAGHKEPKTPGLPPQGQFSPATAVVEFSPGIGSAVKTATLRLYDPRTITSLRIGSRQLPLAANFSEPVHHSLGERNFVAYALGGLFRPELFFDRRGIFLTEPYRSDKVPIIFIHGLQSEPSIWQNAATAVMADPVLGPRCQIWYFVYPTALSVPRSAAELRAQLNKIRKHYRANGDVILIGHSMGGLLSRFQVVDSDDKLWKAYFTKPPGKVGLRADLVREARAALIFPAQPYVERVVFIATPHRGSKLADWAITRMVKRLVRIPQRTLTLVKELLEMNLDTVQPAALPFLRLGGTSLDSLSPTHPYFAALEKCPIRVPFHSIIGNRGDKRLLAGTSDGVVPYSSAHLEGARSEHIVPDRHTCTREADVVSEITRILRGTATDHRRIDPAARSSH